jgi:outer membrane protein assembly factor BamB
MHVQILAMHRMVLPLVLCAAAAVSAADWPAWRGPRGNGVSTETDLPTKWSATDNVRWRVPLPEAGNSTPIVSRGRVFVTQAVGERRTLMCFEREGGKVLWQKGIETKEKEPTHGTNPYCSASPVTDGDRIIVSFASDGLYCYDFAGNELWRRTDLGRQIHIWGNGASPVIHGELCFLNFGPGETTYLLAVNKRNGKTDWRKDEDTGYGKPSADDLRGGNKENATYIGSWTTPTLMRVEGRDQLLMTWPRRLAAYDPQSGDEIWTCSGLNPLVYTSP